MHCSTLVAFLLFNSKNTILKNEQTFSTFEMLYLYHFQLNIGFKSLANHFILFSFYTASQLLWKWGCNSFTVCLLNCLIFLRLLIREEMMVNACWQSFIYFNVFSHFTLWWCSVVDWLVFSLFLRLKLHVAVAELLRYVTKDYCWAGRGCCRGARGPSLSPLLFRPCLPYSIFPKKKN